MASLAPRLREILTALSAASHPGDMAHPGYRLLDGRIALTARVALALERVGWSTAEHWMRLQVQYDLARARRAAA